MRKKLFLAIMVLSLLLCGICFASTSTGTYFHVVWHVLGAEEDTYYSWINILDSSASSNLGTAPAINLSYAIGEQKVCVIEYMTTFSGTHTLTISKTEFISGNKSVPYGLVVKNGNTSYTINSGNNNSVTMSITVVSSGTNELKTYNFPVSLNLSADVLGEMSSGTAYTSTVTLGVTAT